MKKIGATLSLSAQEPGVRNMLPKSLLDMLDGGTRLCRRRGRGEISVAGIVAGKGKSKGMRLLTTSLFGVQKERGKFSPPPPPPPVIVSLKTRTDF